MIYSIFHFWFFHPLRLGNGYNFWSGIGSDLGEITLITGVVMLIRHRNCHVKGCWRLGYADPEHGHPACSKHHTKKHLLGVDPHAPNGNNSVEGQSGPA